MLSLTARWTAGAFMMVGCLSASAQGSGEWRLGHVTKASSSYVRACLGRDKASAGLFSKGEWRVAIQPDGPVPCTEMLYLDIPAKVAYVEAPLMQSTGAFLQGQLYIHCGPDGGSAGSYLCNSEFFEPYGANSRYRVLRPSLIVEAIRQSGLVAAVDQYQAAQDSRRRADAQAAYRRDFEAAKTLEAISAFESKYGSNDPEGLVPQLAQLKSSLRLAEYRRRYEAIRDSKDIEAFIKDYAADDPDGKVPEARSRLEQEQQRAAAEALKAGQQKEAAQRQATVQQLEQRIAVCERDTAAARQTISRERRIGAASGYENKLALRQAGEVIVACEDIVPEARRRLAELRGTSRPAQQQQRSAGAGAYLPWALDVEGYGRGTCQMSDLARSFDEARQWAKQSAGWIDVRSVVESPNKISIAYYDGLIRANSVRVFYKDAASCKSERG